MRKASLQLIALVLAMGMSAPESSTDIEWQLVVVSWEWMEFCVVTNGKTATKAEARSAGFMEPCMKTVGVPTYEWRSY